VLSPRARGPRPWRSRRMPWYSSEMDHKIQDVWQLFWARLR
jgi:hypothetical protein